MDSAVFSVQIHFPDHNDFRSTFYLHVCVHVEYSVEEETIEAWL